MRIDLRYMPMWQLLLIFNSKDLPHLYKALSSSSSLSIWGMEPAYSNIGLVWIEVSFLWTTASGSRQEHWQLHAAQSILSSCLSSGKYWRHCGHGNVSSSRGTLCITCSMETSRFCKSSGSSLPSESSIEYDSRSIVVLIFEHIISSTSASLTRLRGWANSASVRQLSCPDFRQIRANSKPGALRFRTHT